jgi:delta14-sterol reductase
LAPIVEHFWSLLIVASVVAFAWSIALYAYGKRTGAVMKSRTGHEGPGPGWARDFWFGNELNPSWLGVDLKMFMYQPSLLGAYLVVLSFA